MPLLYTVKLIINAGSQIDAQTAVGTHYTHAKPCFKTFYGESITHYYMC